MTENEELKKAALQLKAMVICTSIKTHRSCSECVNENDCGKDEYDTDIIFAKSANIIFDALEELESYRAIGTVEELQNMKDHLLMVKGMCKDYYEIGTIEEFKALKEKSVANETVENDAYLWSCKCPNCGKKIHRGSEERTFYCEQCGIQLHQRAFTEKELDEARFERQMDEYED